MNDPRNIYAHAHAMMVEQVMAVYGRGSSDPVRYRKVLSRMSCAALQRALDETDFPVPSLTENAGVIASTDTGHAPDSVRETLTLQSTLP